MSTEEIVKKPEVVEEKSIEDLKEDAKATLKEAEAEVAKEEGDDKKEADSNGTAAEPEKKDEENGKTEEESADKESNEETEGEKGTKRPADEDKVDASPEKKKKVEETSEAGQGDAPVESS